MTSLEIWSRVMSFVEVWQATLGKRVQRPANIQPPSPLTPCRVSQLSVLQAFGCWLLEALPCAATRPPQGDGEALH